ncbi:MAG: hypothetical protein EBR24_06600 [Flavobacteriia bacterium]|nr:hypothetical protein [Flavobacteriia bacterium]
MKDNKFTPIKISHNHEAERQYTSQFNAKIMRFEGLYNYLSKFISIQDKNTLKSEIYTTFISLFLEKESANFPPNSPVNSILTFFEINTSKIQALIDEFNAIDFDLTSVDLNAPVLPEQDFGTYTKTNEQNLLFTKIDNVIKAIEGLEKLNKFYAPLRPNYTNIKAECFLYFGNYARNLKENFFVGIQAQSFLYIKTIKTRINNAFHKRR